MIVWRLRCDRAGCDVVVDVESRDDIPAGWYTVSAVVRTSAKPQMPGLVSDAPKKPQIVEERLVDAGHYHSTECLATAMAAL